MLNSKKLLSLAKNTNTGHFTWCNPEGSLGPGVRVGRAWKSFPRAGLAQAYGVLSPGSLRVPSGQGVQVPHSTAHSSGSGHHQFHQISRWIPCKYKLRTQMDSERETRSCYI